MFRRPSVPLAEPARRPSLPLLPPSRSIQEVWDPTDRGAGVAAVEAPGRRSSPPRDARRSLTHTHEVALQPRRRPARGATGKSRPGPGAGGGVGASGSPGRAGLAPQRAGGEGLFPRGGGGGRGKEEPGGKGGAWPALRSLSSPPENFPLRLRGAKAGEARAGSRCADAFCAARLGFRSPRAHVTVTHSARFRLPPRARGGRDGRDGGAAAAPGSR